MSNTYSKQVYPGTAWMIFLFLCAAVVLMGATWLVLLVGDERLY